MACSKAEEDPYLCQPCSKRRRCYLSSGSQEGSETDLHNQAVFFPLQGHTAWPPASARQRTTIQSTTLLELRRSIYSTLLIAPEQLDDRMIGAAEGER